MIWSLIWQKKGRCDAIVYMHSGGQSLRQKVSRDRFVVKHRPYHIEKSAVHTLSSVFMLRSMNYCQLMVDPMLHKKLFELSRGILYTIVGVKSLEQSRTFRRYSCRAMKFMCV